jgi:integrase/recombinase XerD
VSVRFRQPRNGRVGYWYIETTWPDGLRTRPTMPDEATAIRINKKIEVAIVDEERIWKKLRTELRLEGGVLQGLSEFADLYYESYVKVHNRAHQKKKSRLDIISRHFGSIPIDSITPLHIDKFVSARRKSGVTNRTINRDLGVLSHMYEWAIKREYLELNPVMKIERLEEIEWVGERPDEAVIDLIFQKLNPRTVPVFSFIRETGCRKNEGITLKWSQVDYARAQVVFHSNTKNGRSRQVPLTEAGLCALSAMPKHGETVFYHPDTLKKWTGDSIAIPWEKARALVIVGEGDAAEPSGLRIHDLRHAYAIKLAEQGCAMHFISEVMGHHSVDFTRKHYGKFSPESASRAVLRVLEGRGTARRQAGGQGF